MKFLPDAALQRLRIAADEPDLSGTPYELIERVGRGGMGVVYRVRDRRLDRDVALKVLDLVDADGLGDDQARLRREAKVLAGLEHPGIVPLHDVGALADGRAFYVMKLVQGERLDHRAARMGSLGERLRLFVRLCEPVAFAHRHGVVHRDLKPENVMIGPFGEVLVMDWGVARVGIHEAAGVVVGTEGYMSPEQARGDTNAVDERSDVFALGAVLRFLIDPPPSPGPSPAPLRSIVARACAADPAARYASVPELAADIESFLDRRTVLAHREGLGERLGRWFHRYETAIVLVMVYVLLRLLLLLAMHR